VPSHSSGIEVLERGQDAANRCQRALGLGLAEQERELVAADPAGHVVRSRAAPDRRGDAAEHQVAGAVSVPEVDVAEAVDVDQRHAQRPAIAPRALDVELELGAKRSQGQQVARDRVARR
jgi:hypothetical protein